MFGRFMNNYYYGKSGKGDYNPEDLPRTRWQLFMEMLRTRLSALCRLNLIYVIPFLPLIVVLVMLFTNTMSIVNEAAMVDEALLQINTGTVQADGSVVIAAAQEGGESTTYTKDMIESLHILDAAYEVDDQLLAIYGGTVQEDGSVVVTTADGAVTYTREAVEALKAQDEADTAAGIYNQGDRFRSLLLSSLLWLIPCIFITGPWTAGVAYVTRNWARDEHAFLWSDCRDAMKANWKSSLVLSAITAVVPIIVYLCWTFYGEMAADGMFMLIVLQMGQMIPVMVGIIWYLAVTYAYPMLVTYDMKITTVIRNSLILAVGRLPQSIGIRLLHCVPAALGLVLTMFINSIWVPLILLMYYVLFGFAFSRFITASYTNAQFDKLINSRIEGAKVNQGLAEEDDEDYDDEDDEGERELKPWENGYADR